MLGRIRLMMTLIGIKLQFRALSSILQIWTRTMQRFDAWQLRKFIELHDYKEELEYNIEKWEV